MWTLILESLIVLLLVLDLRFYPDNNPKQLKVL